MDHEAVMTVTPVILTTGCSTLKRNSTIVIKVENEII